MMGEYPSWPLILFMAFCSAFLTAGRTALTQLPDAEVKKLAASERKRDRRIAHDLENLPRCLRAVSWRDSPVQL